MSYYEDNKKERIEYQKEYYKKNRDKIVVYNSFYYFKYIKPKKIIKKKPKSIEPKKIKEDKAISHEKYENLFKIYFD